MTTADAIRARIRARHPELQEKPKRGKAKAKATATVRKQTSKAVSKETEEVKDAE